MRIRRKNIKLNGKIYYIGVYTYANGRMKLQYENSTEHHDITINLDDIYIEEGKVILNSTIKNNGILKILKKNRIIKEICGYITYDKIDFPVAILNFGILRSYDYFGMNNYLLAGSQSNNE